MEALRYTGKLGTMASEEEDMPVSAALNLEDGDVEREQGGPRGPFFKSLLAIF